MIMQKILKILLLSILSFSFFGKEILFAYSTSDIVDISLKLSLCGDGIVEGPEDCELTSEIIKTCLDFGYQSGLLTCDYSCSYDYSACKYIPKKETEKPNLEKSENEKKENIISKLPFFIGLFDLNRDGKIDFTEFTNILYTWVDNWKLFREASLEDKEDVKGTCDVNNDKVCNVIDFSIILYYIDND